MKRSLSILLLFILGAAFTFAQNYVIDDYLFRWNVCRVNNVSLIIEKDNEKTVVEIINSESFINSTMIIGANEVHDVSVLLEKANEYFTEQKTKNDDVTEELVSGIYKATYTTSLKNGFTVNIAEKDELLAEGFNFKLKEASTLGKELDDIPNKLAYVNKIVNY